MSKPILFLDVDGVLNSRRTTHAFGRYPYKAKPDDIPFFDLVAVGLIRNLCKVTGAQIVLSSTWRKTVGCKDLGKALDLPMISSTPSLYGNRGSEIDNWLSQHPKVKVFAIVDDDSDMLKKQLPFFVQTNFSEGLSFANYQRLVEILKNERISN